MNTDNFSIQSSLEANYLNINLEQPIRLDEIAIKAIQMDCPDFLIPFSVLDVNDSVALRYKLVNTIALAYFDSSVSKVNFLNLFLKLVTPFVKGKDWFLNYKNLCIDPQYVYLDKNANKVFYIYVPEASYLNTDDDILSYLKDILNVINISDDAELQLKMYKFFAKSNINLADLYDFLLDEQAKCGAKGTEMAASKPVSYDSAPLPVIPNIGQQPVNPAPMQMNSAPSAPVQQTSPIPPVTSATSNLFGGKENKKHTFGVGKQTKADPFAAPNLNAGVTNNSNVGMNNTKQNSSLDASASQNSMNAASGSTASAPMSSDADAMDALFGAKPKKNNGGLFGGLFSSGKENKKEKPDKGRDAGKVVKIEGANAARPVIPQPTPANMNMGMTTVLPYEEEGMTVMMSEEASIKVRRLELVESQVPGAPSVIKLDFPENYILLGRKSNDSVQPDVAFDTSFKFISRKHLRIQRDGNNYFAIDLGSPNHTFLDGEMLIPNVPKQLVSGSILTLTNSSPVRYRVVL